MVSTISVFLVTTLRRVLTLTCSALTVIVGSAVAVGVCEGRGNDAGARTVDAVATRRACTARMATRASP